ncbi:hypothetical protein A2392_03305 [Candidatus Kaiserbacteria bacterium RIFOXYB1_FULL_46_14]|uniref:PKD domain-containing protein n=1 Tax=Candidatus Kaiserbacteria bacterium RIFOXYB1_FULL_46_14 TaxID=1798531 RepID=A0A1F6FHZ5_9BACT|nr:MAG: hypothetical protein A2392_03305 [Candidatus Kaiserbacteria bacterium RIFOXYB1_FULL_46_14]
MKRVVLGLLLSLIPLPALALVNINTATLDELDTLPGVGAVTAQKITDARPFESTSEIQNVQGIGGPGTKTYEDIIGLITVEGATVSETDDSSDSLVSKSATAKDEDDIKVQKPVSGLVINAPDYSFVGQVVNFEAVPSDGDQGRLVRYWWNFGDGYTADSKVATHQYRHPGTYVVVVESYYLKKTHITRHEITILSPQLSVRSDQGSFVITNKSDHEIDLFGMTLSGVVNWSFPKYSILLPDASLAIDSSVVKDALVVRLLGADGRVLAVSDSEKVATKSKSVAYAPAPRISAVSTNVSAQVIDQSPTPSVTDGEIGSNVSVLEPTKPTQTANLSDANIPAKSWPYLGLMAVVSLGLFAVWKGNARL